MAAVAALAMSAGAARGAVVTGTVSPTELTSGFMNVFDLGMGYQFGSVWGIPDLKAEFGTTTLTLKANFVNDTSPYWYQVGPNSTSAENPGSPGAPGNKIMDANLYRDAAATPGDTVTFSGVVLSNTLAANGYTSTAFIKVLDPAAGYATVQSQTVALTPGAFNLALATDPVPGRIVQYGFETIGRNAWSTDVDSKGSVVIALAVVPEPASLAAIAGVAGVGLIRRRRRA